MPSRTWSPLERLDDVVRVLRYALPAIVVSLGLLLVSAGGTWSHASAPSVALWLIMCTAGGLSVLHPVSSSVAIGVVLTLAVTVPSVYIGVAVFAVLFAFGATVARCKLLTCIVIGVWFAAVLVAPTIAAALTAADIVAGAGIWLFLLAAATAVGLMIRRLGDLLGESRARRISDLDDQRRALARELHDTAVRATTEVIMIAERSRLRPHLDPISDQDLERISESARSATEELRSAMDALRRSEETGDVPVLRERHASTLLEAPQQRLIRAGYTVNVDLEGEASLPGAIAEPLSRGLAELTANVIRHGDDSHPVALMMEADADRIDLIMMNRARTPDGTELIGGSGLIGTRERLADIGATLDTRSDGASYLAQLSIPLQKETR